MKVENLNISEIFPYDKNPRNNKNAVKATANSIKEFGFQQPIVVDKDNVIIVGHTRYSAAKKLKLKTVPIVVADQLSDEKVKAYRLADNKTHDLSDWDDNLLDEELEGILNIDMEQFGFEDEEIEEDEKDISDSIKEVYQVVINCKDEEDLESTYNQLDSEGYDCTISTL